MTRLSVFLAFVLLMAALVWYAVTRLERISAIVLSDSTVVAEPENTRRAVAVLEPLGAPCGTHCGDRRWAVKTLSDVDRELVDLRPTPATVESLASLPRPGIIEEDRRADPVELTTYEVEGCLGIIDLRRGTDSLVHRRMARRVEGDGDIHLVISGLVDPRVSLIAEIPNPACNGVCPSGLGGYFRAVRAVVDSILQRGPVSPECNNDVPLVRITGVGFFDYPHGQIGAPRNQFELHPVLELKVAESAVIPSGTRRTPLRTGTAPPRGN